MFRDRLAGRLCRAIRRRARRFDRTDLAQSCVVLAPHPDDEVLACGGTIARKRELGAAVRIVFATDGSRSHPGIDPAEMRAQRHAEAIEAAAILGVGADHLHFLDVEDGMLDRGVDAAARRLAGWLADWRPAQLFAPCAEDTHADHAAANAMARRALAAHGGGCELYEYSVYLWRTWPWSRPDEVRWARASLSLARFAAGVTHAVDCDGVLDRKRAALAAHRSQMERRGGDPSWWTLRDWAGGDFVRWSLAGGELFRHR